MKSPVSSERWREAQRAEREYWNWPIVDPRELARIVLGLSEAAVWAKERFPAGIPSGDWVEFGIGPLGLGCSHFLTNQEGRPIVGVDPLPLIPTEEFSLAPPLATLIDSCRAGYEHVVAPGESTGLEDGRFGLAILHNMLDHVRDPFAVLVEARRLLRPGGIMFLRCDTFSLPSRLRFRAVTRFRRSDTWLVRAHPFRFGPDELVALVRQAGFRVLAHDSLGGARLRELVGGSYRASIMAEKAAEPVDARPPGR